MLVDAHAHLTDPRYGDVAGLVGNMESDGLEKIVTVGFDLASSIEGKVLAERFENVYFTCGVHPSDSKGLDETQVQKLLELTRHPKCVAVGEIGLDYHSEDTDRDAQARALRLQLELVRQADLPVVFHLRDAYGDFDAQVVPYLKKLPRGAVLHCYSGSKEFALQYVRRDFYFSFTGSITFKNNRTAAEVLPIVPRERLLVETDCPYLTPEPHRGTLNYPAYVRFVAEKAAALRGETLEDLTAYTTNNAYRFYHKMTQ